jgi:hypothetical protein
MKLKDALERLEMLNERYDLAKLRESDLKDSPKIKRCILERNRISNEGLIWQL